MGDPRFPLLRLSASVVAMTVGAGVTIGVPYMLIFEDDTPFTKSQEMADQIESDVIDAVVPEVLGSIVFPTTTTTAPVPSDEVQGTTGVVVNPANVTVEVVNPPPAPVPTTAAPTTTTTTAPPRPLIDVIEGVMDDQGTATADAQDDGRPGRRVGPGRQPGPAEWIGPGMGNSGNQRRGGGRRVRSAE